MKNAVINIRTEYFEEEPVEPETEDVPFTEDIPVNDPLFEDKNFISLSADPSYSIKITYSNKKLLDEKSAKEEQEILEDF